VVSTGYFQTMESRCCGAEFTGHDVDTSGRVAIINEASARRYWPNEDPIGQRISIGQTAERRSSAIVGDMRDEGPRRDATPRSPTAPAIRVAGHRLRASGDAGDLERPATPPR
jgi:hypothetical protein